MKKFYLIVLASILCLALVAPAMAKVTTGGIIFTDVFQTTWDENFMRNTVGRANDGDFEQFDIQSTYGTRWWVKAVNDKNDVGAYIEVRVLGENNFTHNAVGLPEGLEADQMYGWWQINPMFKLTVGQQMEFFSQLNTYNYFGSDHTAYAASKGFGNIGGNKFPSVRLDAKISDAITISGLMGYAALSGAAGSWGNWDNENTTPRFDIGLEAKIGPVTIYPSYAWHEVQYDRDLASAAGTANSDDSITTWGFSFPADVSFGPFKLEGEYNIGQNLSDSNIDVAYTQNPGGVWWGGSNRLKGTMNGSGAALWANVGGRATVIDADYTGWWLAGTYSFTRSLKFKLVYGQEDVEYDIPASIAPAFPLDTDRDGWTASIQWVPAKVFSIAPFYGVYDHGTSSLGSAGALAPVDLGEVKQIGVEFMIVF
ncbi:MAG: hypothetical protein JW944_03530 [Deltaproteobacteria bacterium]|nr:hypothetical protein [Deltaproteobacteria bacterium]